MASEYRAIFLDDGGLISDNDARGPQWRRFLGEFFPPILGGTPEQWAAANVQVMDSYFEMHNQAVGRPPRARAARSPARRPRRPLCRQPLGAESGATKLTR